MKYLLVGRIIKPHGIHGEVGVKSLTERPDLRFKETVELLVGPDQNNLRKAVVKTARPFKQGFLVALEGIERREEAEGLRNWEIYIHRRNAARIEDGAYYHHELIGLNLIDLEGEKLGCVCGVLETPANDLLEVETGSEGRFYLPLVNEFVHEVNSSDGYIKVSLPDGLTDVYRNASD